MNKKVLNHQLATDQPEGKVEEARRSSWHLPRSSTIRSFASNASDFRPGVNVLYLRHCRSVKMSFKCLSLSAFSD